MIDSENPLEPAPDPQKPPADSASPSEPMPAIPSDSDMVEPAAVSAAPEVDAAELESPEEHASEETAPEPETEAQPLELIEEAEGPPPKEYFILKVQVNRENTICDALRRRIKVEGLEDYFGDILVPTEEVVEFTKAGKKRIVKRKLYPGYIVVHMAINDDTWFLVRETPGIGDFTGAAGKPTPMSPQDVGKIIKKTDEETGEVQRKTSIKFKQGDRVRVKEGYFQNFEGEVDAIDEANGRVTVMINIFGRSTPVELEHWHIEDV